MSGGKLPRLPRVDVGIIDDVDVAVIFVDSLGSVEVVYRDLREALDLAKQVSAAVETALSNRKRKQRGES